MRAVDRTVQLFKKSVEEALPGIRMSVARSCNAAGHSRYVYIYFKHRAPIKVRISDHAVGMRRALSGECDLFISAGAGPDRWAVWLSEIAARYASKASTTS